ncbi:MAG: NUDIX domain-containing protein [Lactococcus sp.]|nr:NUDIX domain-containing protein [Lactococcus sp.]MDN5410192.1 NUDIX domain-containing protein [Lactococcus sp.]MDN5435486.1 NUDIX domain-containing protein [Lactococcus sp.]MDN5982839.1 NUDIX domain-containing protein [Lactococcus sp.]MDN6106288.1 NUDIX domain-containing protein [Lactococcus sp.]MDN6118951.1 NUDIX domain-containing protein [Lactococcus sp.]
MENIISFVNICVKNGDNILLINRQHDHFKGWIPPGGKVIFPESFFEAAIRELEEETAFSGSLKASREGVPKWWPISSLDTLPMQAEIRQRLPLYFRAGSFESINYWDNDTKAISKNSTKLYD